MLMHSSVRVPTHQFADLDRFGTQLVSDVHSGVNLEVAAQMGKICIGGLQLENRGWETHCFGVPFFSF